MIESRSDIVKREVTPELDFPELENYNEYLKASRLYVNRAGAVSQEQVELFENTIAAADDESPSNDFSLDAPALGEGLQEENLVGGDKVAFTLGMLRSVVGL